MQLTWPASRGRPGLGQHLLQSGRCTAHHTVIQPLTWPILRRSPRLSWCLLQGSHALRVPLRLLPIVLFEGIHQAIDAVPQLTDQRLPATAQGGEVCSTAVAAQLGRASCSTLSVATRTVATCKPESGAQMLPRSSQTKAYLRR